MANTKRCSHFQLPIADPGPCLACERAEMGGTPLVSFAGGKDEWHNGQTVAETMRTNVADWKERGIDAQPIDRGRWV